MIPAAALRHYGRGRVRLGVPAMRGDAGYFEWVSHGLRAACAGEVTVNPQTAGILIDGFADSLMRLQSLGRQHDWFDLYLGSGADDQGVRPDSGPALPFDRRTLAIAAVLSMAVYQALKGELLGPAAGYLLNAAEIGRWLEPGQ